MIRRPASSPLFPYRTLFRSGFVLDSEPMAMALDLDGAIEAPGPDELDWTDDPSPAELAGVVEPSYGFPAGMFAAGFPGGRKSTRLKSSPSPIPHSGFFLQQK